MKEKNYIGITIITIGELLMLSGIALLIFSFFNIAEESMGATIVGFMGLIPAGVTFLVGTLIKGFGEIINLLHAIKNEFQIRE